MLVGVIVVIRHEYSGNFDEAKEFDEFININPFPLNDNDDS